jgi:hypothetical protein
MSFHVYTDNKLALCEKYIYSILLKDNERNYYSLFCANVDRNVAISVLHMLLDLGKPVELYYRDNSNTLTRL